jgi:hypothetical protein
LKSDHGRETASSVMIMPADDRRATKPLSPASRSNNCMRIGFLPVHPRTASTTACVTSFVAVPQRSGDRIPAARTCSTAGISRSVAGFCPKCFSIIDAVSAVHRTASCWICHSIQAWLQDNRRPSSPCFGRVFGGLSGHTGRLRLWHHPNPFGDRGHAVLVHQEQHVPAGRRQVAVVGQACPQVASPLLHDRRIHKPLPAIE